MKLTMLCFGNGYVELVNNATGAAAPVWSASVTDTGADFEIDPDPEFPAPAEVDIEPCTNSLTRRFVRTGRRNVAVLWLA